MMINHVTQLERNKSPVGHIIPIRGFVSCRVLVILLMWPVLFVLGHADSRAAMIEEERELKEAQLERKEPTSSNAAWCMSSGTESWSVPGLG